VGPIHLGIDTSKNTIAVAVLMPGEEIAVLDLIWNEGGSVGHLVGRLGEVSALRACYEAGRAGLSCTGFLSSMGRLAMWWRRR
jgi:hypothetical protein